MKIHIVHRRITFQLGDAVVQAVQGFESEREAQQAALKRDAAIKELLRAKMVDPATGESLEGQVKDLIHDLGIEGIGHAVVAANITEASRIISPHGDNVVPIDGHDIVRG